MLVTFEPLDIQQCYIPLLKALMCGINAVGAQGSGCIFTLCHAPLKMAVLLHKTEKVWDSFSETVILGSTHGAHETTLEVNLPGLELVSPLRPA